MAKAMIMTRSTGSKAVVPLAQTRKIILRDTPVSMGIR